MAISPRTIVLLLGVVIVVLLYRYKNMQSTTAEIDLTPRRKAVQLAETPTPRPAAAAAAAAARAAKPPSINQLPEEDEQRDFSNRSVVIDRLRTRINFATAYEIYKTVGISFKAPLPLEYDWEPGDPKSDVIGLTGVSDSRVRIAVAAAKTSNLADMKTHITQLWELPQAGWKPVAGRAPQNCKNCRFYSFQFEGQHGMALLAQSPFQNVSYFVGLSKPTVPTQQDWALFMSGIEIRRPENY